MPNGHHTPRPQLISQKTKDALAALPTMDHLTAARICNVRTSPVGQVTKQDLKEVFFALYDAVRPFVEKVHAINPRRSVADSLDRMVQHYKDQHASEELQTVSNQ